MADFNITISERLNLFGIAPTNKWNGFAWNAFKWGDGADVVTDTGKQLSESLTLTDSLSKEVIRVIAESLALAADMSSEGLKNGAWSYVFVSNTTEAEDRDPTTWASGTAGSTTWTSAAAGSTTWS